jgi:flagellar protein FliO/FliZ
MVVVLALVLAAIYGVYRLMKRVARPKTAESSAVRLLASTSLGPGKTLHVVALGAKAYLVGATDSSITLVAQVEDKEFLDALTLEATTSPSTVNPGAGRDFGTILTGLLGGKRRSAPHKAQTDLGFLAGQRERLKKF